MSSGTRPFQLRTRIRLLAHTPRAAATHSARRPRALRPTPAKLLPAGVCYPDQFGRILKSDHSGRSFWAHHRARLSGVRQLKVLSQLKVGESGILIALDLPESVQNHLMHMGFVPSALVTALRRAPAGDPTVYAIDGMEIALRTETAQAISVRSTEPAAAAQPAAETPSLAEALQ
jgi:ferrous iron transport protein A